MSVPIRITHLIVRLSTGGAEKSLYRLLRHTSGQLQHEVICIGRPTPIGRDIEALGVKVVWLDERRSGPLVLWQAWHRLKQHPPDVLQGWMYYGNLLASLFRRGLPGSTRVAWNIRTSFENFNGEKLATRCAVQLGRLAWLRPDLVIYNSYAGRQAHADLGYNRHPHRVIPNGIDLDEFSPDESVRAEVRGQCNSGGGPWVGLVSRYHPLKGVDQFLGALHRLREAGSNARFLLAGPGMQADNPELVRLMAAQGIEPDDVSLLGEIASMQSFLPALDVLVLASHREGTPNILLEAMASGVYTVSTRVGDAERIIRDRTRLVAPGDVEGLASAIRHGLAGQDKVMRVTMERNFLQENYDINRCMSAYLEGYENLSGRPL